MGIGKVVERIPLLLCLGLGLHSRASDVAVFAAASLNESLTEIARGYQKSTGDKVMINFGASSTLARQIEEGAPADIFFSADQAQMSRLEGKGLIVQGTRRDRLMNSLVIIVSVRDGAKIQSPRDLASPRIRHVALGDPRTVPIGVYARKFLEQAGLWDAVAPKVVPTENVRGALAAVESGDADASIVYHTDAMISPKVRVAYHVPKEQTPDIRYPIGLVRGGKDPDAARRFLEFLTSESATKVFEKRGFATVR